MRTAWLMLAAALAASGAGAQEVFCVWQSEKTDDGRYLNIEIHPCADDRAKVCGTIVGAFGGARAENVGKPIIWDMVPTARTPGTTAGSGRPTRTRFTIPRWSCRATRSSSRAACSAA